MLPLIRREHDLFSERWDGVLAFLEKFEVPVLVDHQGQTAGGPAGKVVVARDDVVPASGIGGLHPGLPSEVAGVVECLAFGNVESWWVTKRLVGVGQRIKTAGEGVVYTADVARVVETPVTPMRRRVVQHVPSAFVEFVVGRQIRLCTG